MKTMKKFLTIIICIAMIFCFFVPVSADGTSLEATPVRFNSDGKLKIMHLTDTHLSSDNNSQTLWLINRILTAENPDIVVLTGDIAMNGTWDEVRANIDSLMKIFDSHNVPVAITFGNHDSENGYATREQLMKIYQSYESCIALDDGDAMEWCGTYVVPVLACDSDELKFNLWVFDSGDYDNEQHYSNVSEGQVAWYKAQSEAYEQQYGHKINSLAFQHIIVPEIYEALDKSAVGGAYKFEHMYPDGYYYFFSNKYEHSGLLNETCCCGYYNHGQFDAMVERGDVLGMFFGHDHTNCFTVNYKGINLTNSLSARYSGGLYDTQYGYRIIEVDENDTSTYTSAYHRWFDLFDIKQINEISDSGDEYGTKLATTILFNGFFKKLGMKIAEIVVECFTGRTVA